MILQQYFLWCRNSLIIAPNFIPWRISRSFSIHSVALLLYFSSISVLECMQGFFNKCFQANRFWDFYLPIRSTIGSTIVQNFFLKNSADISPGVLLRMPQRFLQSFFFQRFLQEFHTFCCNLWNSCSMESFRNSSWVSFGISKSVSCRIQFKIFIFKDFSRNWLQSFYRSFSFYSFRISLKGIKKISSSIPTEVT